MGKLTKQFLNATLTLLLLYSSFIVKSKNDTTQPSKVNVSVNEARNLRTQSPDSSLETLQKIYDYSIQNADTVKAINALMGLAYVYGHQANYKESYDRLWVALLLADAANIDLRKSSVYRSIGRYYSFYNRKENAIKFLNLSIGIKKDLVKNQGLEKSSLVENYLSFCATYRELNELELGKAYLDSCFMFYSNTSNASNQYSLMKFEKAVIFNLEDEPNKALELFQEILPGFEKNNPSYQVLVYNYMGDTYKNLGDYDASEESYLKALEISEEYNSHIDFTPLVHERLSNLYFLKRDYLQAFISMRTAKRLDANFFDSRSENNRPLLEIQDAFREEKKEQAILLREQRLLQLEQEEKVLFLQKTLLIGFIFFLILFGILYFNSVRAKHRTEKELIQKKKELEIQKANELVELKNKELAASVLKLIEKEAFIDNLKDQLSKGEGDLKRQEVKQIVRSMSNSNAKNWKEFEARFLAVNKSFYQRLNAQFPNLTQGDQKLCALVKLNFSSKEMSKLLSISVESVHTTRSRLRKKLNLSRGTNLKEFIANI